MADDNVRVTVDERAVDAVVRSVDMRDLLLEAAEPIEARVVAGAPKASGEGARSIRSEPVLDGPDWTVRISWDRAHFYLYFHDRGTRRLPARPFLEPALDTAL
ncbi:HK97-gp10 family putative phage morphogenesis protein [Micromonospora sp. NPDC005163]